MIEINFKKRESIKQVEESNDLAPKFDENGLILTTGDYFDATGMMMSLQD